MRQNNKSEIVKLLILFFFRFYKHRPKKSDSTNQLKVIRIIVQFIKERLNVTKQRLTPKL